MGALPDAGSPALVLSYSSRMTAVAVVSALLRRLRRLAVVFSLMPLTTALFHMESVFNVGHGAIFAFGELFESLQHCVRYAVLPREFERSSLLAGNFAPLRP